MFYWLCSGIRLCDCSILAINWKNNIDVTIYQHDVIFKNFSRCLILLIKLVTGPSLMSISLPVLELWQFFIRDWPGILILEIPPFWVLPNIWRLGRVRDPKYGTNVSNELLLCDAKCQGYRFYRFYVIIAKLTGELKLPPPLPPRRPTHSIRWIAFASVSNSFYLLKLLLLAYNDFWCIYNPTNKLKYGLYLLLLSIFLFLFQVFHQNQWLDHNFFFIDGYVITLIIPLGKS